MDVKERKDGVTCIYLLIKLKEVGFAEGHSPELTPEGFEEAMTLQDEGYNVSKEVLIEWLPMLGVQEVDMTAELALHMQEKGFEFVKRESDRLNKPWYLRIFNKK